MSNAQFGSLTVLGGPLAGRQVVLDQAVDEILIGSDPDCAVYLDLPGVSPVHARLWMDATGAAVHDTRSPRGLYVNDDPVTDSVHLKDGDILWLGPPGDPDSVMIQCRFDAVQEASPAASLLEWPEEEAPAPAVEYDDAPAVQAAAPVYKYESEFDLGEAGESIPLRPPDPDEAPVEELVEPPLEMAAEAEAAPAEAFPAFAFDEPAAEPEPSAEPEPELVMAEPPAPAPEPEPFAAFDESPEPVAEPEPEPFVMPEAAPAPAAEPDAFQFDEPAAAAPADDAVFVIEEPGPRVADVEVEKLDLDNTWEAAPAWQPPAAEAPAAEEEEDVFDASAEEEPSAPVPPAAPPPAPVAPVAAAAAVTAAAAAKAATPAKPAAPTPRPAAPSKPVPGRAAATDESPWEQSGEASAPAVAPAPRAAAVARPGGARVAARGGGKPIAMIAGAAAVALLLAGGAWFFLMRQPAPKLAGVSPARVSRGAKLTLSGENLGADGLPTSVTVGGLPAKVIQAGATSLQVEVPEVKANAGADTPVPVVVQVGEKATAEPVSVAIYVAPRVKSLEPSAALAGDEILLRGDGFGGKPTVTFGAVTAEVLEVKPDSVRVKVPELQGAPGSTLPVVLKSGAEATAPLALLVGHLPLVLAVQPAAASPGDTVQLTGHGFAATAAQNDVRIGEQRALVVSATPTQITIVVPRTEAAEAAALTVRVPDSTFVGAGTLAVGAAPEPPGFRFVAEPMTDDAGHLHAMVVSPLGTAFVLSDAGGRSAGERAAEAQGRLNAAAESLTGSSIEDFALKTRGNTLAINLLSRDTPVLEVTAEDAAAHGEPWAGSSAAPTPGRLATWWHAVLQDLGEVLARGAKASHAAGLSAGAAKPLADLTPALKRPPLTGKAIASLKAGTRDGLRNLARRVPDEVSEPAGLSTASAGAAPPPPTPAPVVTGATPLPTAAPTVAAFKLEGEWVGMEVLGGLRTSVTVVFGKGGGSITFERAVPLKVNLTSLQDRKGKVSYRAAVGTSTRFYSGSWNGEKITGNVASDEAGKNVIGNFELQPNR